MPTAAHKDKRLHLSKVLLIYTAPTLDAKVISCHSSRSRVQITFTETQHSSRSEHLVAVEKTRRIAQEAQLPTTCVSDGCFSDL